MSEIRDTIAFFEAVDRSLDEQAKVNAEVDAKFHELERQIGVLDQSQETMNNQIDIFRTAINEGFERLRRELRGGKR